MRCGLVFFLFLSILTVRYWRGNKNYLSKKMFSTVLGLYVPVPWLWPRKQHLHCSADEC